MSTATTLRPDEDPSLAALMPRPSRARNAGLVAGAAAAVLVAAWLGSVTGMNIQPRGGAAELLPGGRIAYAGTMDAPRAPGMRLDGVRAPQGTTLDGVWVLTADDPDPLAGASLMDTLDAVGADPSRSRELPQAVPAGELRYLLLLTVDDCALVEDGAAQGTVQPDGSLLSVPPALTVRSFVGSAASIDLEWFGWSRAELEAAGACA